MAPIRAIEGSAFEGEALRPLSELTAAWPQILDALDALDLAPDTPFEALTPQVRYLLGVHAAAAWCLGATSRAPMAWADRPVLFADLADEQATALQVARRQNNGWEDYARGVTRWMFFLTGVIHVLVLTEE